MKPISTFLIDDICDLFPENPEFRADLESGEEARVLPIYHKLCHECGTLMADGRQFILIDPKVVIRALRGSVDDERSLLEKAGRALRAQDLKDQLSAYNIDLMFEGPVAANTVH